MHSSQCPRRPRGPAPTGRLTLGLLGLLAAALLMLSPPAAYAQTSTPVYGSDTQYVAYLQPLLQTGGYAHYNSAQSLVMGQPSQSGATFGSAYDPDLVDVSQGFVARVGVDFNDSYGLFLVVQNPSAPDYSTRSLVVDFISSQQNPAQSHQCHLTHVLVYVTAADGGDTVLADVQGLDIDPRADSNGILQVRYLPRFSTLDVYVGPHLITRVPNVDLARLGIAPGGTAKIGVLSNVPGRDGNTDFNPAYLNHFSIGNQLSFGAGFGPNFYEDRFPFASTGQSVWGPNTPSFEYKKFLGASSDGQTKTSNTGGTDFSVAGQPVFSLHTSGFASYDVGIGIDATATGGTADISYPLFLDMSFPKQYSVASGTAFTLPLSFYPDLAASLSTTTPSANVKASLKCITRFGVNLDTSVFGQSIASGNLFTASVNVPETTFFDAQQILTSGLIPNVNGGVNYAGYVQGDEGKTGTKSTTEHGTPGAGSSAGAGAGSLLSKFVTVGITIPDLSTSGTITGFGTSGSHLTSSASSPFVSLRSDFTNSVLAEIPGLDILTALPFFNNDYSLNLGGQSVELGFHIADVYGSVNVGTAVAYDFTPQPQVYFTLAPADPSHPNPWGPFALDPATHTLTNPPALTMPGDGSPLTVTPSVVLNDASTFQTTGSFTIGGSLSINPLSLSFGYNGTQFSTDPYFGFPLTVAGSIPVYNYTKQFPVGTFQTSLQGKAFTLFPTASPNPLIDSVAPASAAVGSADLPISLTTEQASINGDVVWDYDGVPADPQTNLSNRVWNSNTGITATVSAALLTTQGAHTITLINHGNGDANLYPSNLYTFTVNAPAPVLTGLTPGGVTAGGQAFTLALSGSGFSPPVAPAGGVPGYPGSVVTWNGHPVPTTYTSAGSLSAAIPAGLIASAGTASVTVTTAGPGGGASAARTLTITAPVVNPTPVLSSLSRTSSASGLSSLSLTLSGAGFVPGASVLLNNGTTTSTRAASFVSSSTLGLTLTSADLSRNGAFTLRVQNPAPVSGPSAALTLTVGTPPPGGGGFSLAPSVTRVSGGYRVALTFSNTSQTTPVDSTIITSVTVGGDSSGRNAVYPTLPNPLEPILLSTLPVGGRVTASQTYTFPASIGVTGRAVLLTIRGSEGGQTFTTRLRVVLP